MTSDEPPGTIGYAVSLLKANADHRIPYRSHEL